MVLLPVWTLVCKTLLLKHFTHPSGNIHKHVWHWSSRNLFSCFPIVLSGVISGQMGRLLIFYCNSTRIWLHPRKIPIFFHSFFFFLTSFCCVFSLCKYSLWWEQRQKQNTCLHRTRVTYLNHWSLLSYIVGKNITFGEKRIFLDWNSINKKKKGVERCEVPYLIPHKYKTIQ